MSDEFKLSQAASKGARAQELLGNELLTKAYEEIEANLIAGWIGSDPRDVEGREKAWAQLHANRNHRAQIQSMVTDGKMATAELMRMAEEEDRAKLFGRR